MLLVNYVKFTWHKISCRVAQQLVVVGLVVLSVGLVALDDSINVRLVAQDIYLVNGAFENDDTQDKAVYEFFRTTFGAIEVFSGHSAISNIVVSNLRPLNSRLRGPPLHSLS